MVAGQFGFANATASLRSFSQAVQGVAPTGAERDAIPAGDTQARAAISMREIVSTHVGSIADDATASEQAAGNDVSTAVAAAAVSAPQFLVNTVEQIQDVVISMLHSSEPAGKDILSTATTLTQNAVKPPQASAQAAIQTGNATQGKVTAARAVANATTQDPTQQATINGTADQAQAGVSAVNSQLSVYSALLSDTADCQKMKP